MIARLLCLGYYAGSSGVYTLGGGSIVVAAGGSVRIAADGGVGRFAWFGGTLTAPALTLEAEGTLAIGFDCGAASLVTGSLYGGKAPAGLGSATLEVTNDATMDQGIGSAVAVGSLRVGSATGPGRYEIKDGHLAVAAFEYVGEGGVGAFVQRGGRHAVGAALYLGSGVGSCGTYELGGTGVLVAGAEYIGADGAGLFSHVEGNNSIVGALYLGYGEDASGEYMLRGGRLAAWAEYVGYRGEGILTQSGGSNVVAWSLVLGYDAGSSGCYLLSESGRLTTGVAYVGFGGEGSFLQSGGDCTVGGALVLGRGEGSTGTFLLSGTARLTAGAEYVGLRSAGTFLQSGGAHIVIERLLIGTVPDVPGTFALSGGSLSVPSVLIGSGGSLLLYGGIIRGSWSDDQVRTDLRSAGLIQVVSGSHALGRVLSEDDAGLSGAVRVDAGAALSADVVRQASLAVGPGGVVVLREGFQTSVLGSLDLAGRAGAWTATLDITGNCLVIRDASVQTVEDQVRGGLNLASGY